MSEGTFIVGAGELATDRQSAGREVVVSLADKPVFAAGRRAWVKYRELGLTEATGGGMRAQVIHAGTANESTGWHLHRCDVQFLYVMSGAISIAFSPRRIIRLGAGDSIMIPGGTIHMELGAPEGVEVLEVSIPADMATENVESPWGDEEIDFGMAAGHGGP